MYMQEGYIDSVSVMERAADLGCEQGFGSGLILTGSNLSKFEKPDPDLGKKSG